MDSSHNQSGSVINSGCKVIVSYLPKFLCTSTIGLSTYVVSQTKPPGSSIEIGGISILPNTLIISKIFKLYGLSGSLC